MSTAVTSDASFHYITGTYSYTPPTSPAPTNPGLYSLWVSRLMNAYDSSPSQYETEYTGFEKHSQNKSTLSFSRENFVQNAMVCFSESEKTETVWQAKIKEITNVLLAPQIKAVSFVPTDPEISQTLFVEKLENFSSRPTYHGYVKPNSPHSIFLDENAHPVEQYDYPALLDTESDLSYELASLTEGQRESAEPILRTFFEGDPQTKILGLTFMDGTVRLWTHA
jgi:hypothetical protein